MAKFRTRTIDVKTTNLAGGEAYKEDPKLELVSLLLTSFVSDKFYESANEQLDRLSNLVSTIPDKRFIGKSAIYARQEFGMRSITHALIGELVKVVKGEEWTKYAVSKTIKRPDDMLEMLGYYWNKYGIEKNGKNRPIPNSMKKGLALAINKFDAYQLAKYKGGKSSVKMIDLLNLVHPSPSNENKEAFAKLIKNELKSKGTWETELTKAGQEVQDIKDEEEKEKILAEKKAKTWEILISEKKLGYFALLRNLRNIIEQSPNILDKALEMLTDEKLIKKSLVLPFRYNIAMQEIEKISDSRKVIQAINKALEISLSNVPKFKGKTLVVLDESGSMGGRFYNSTGKDPIDIGALFAAVLYKTNDADLMMFSDEARYKNLNPDDSIATLTERMKKDLVGSGTNFCAPFETANKKYDRIILLSDMQGWIEDGWGSSTPNKKAFPDYCKRTGADPFVYSFDLQGYGQLEFPQNKVFCLAGWSEKILDVMELLEQDRNALISKIEQIEL